MVDKTLLDNSIDGDVAVISVMVCLFRIAEKIDHVPQQRALEALIDDALYIVMKVETKLRQG